MSSFRASRSDIKASREEAKKLLAEAGVPNLKFLLWNRNLAMPYTPAGIFLVDQWRQIGVEVEHKQSDTAPYLAAMASGNYDVAIDFSNLFMDDSDARACQIPVVRQGAAEHVALEGSASSTSSTTSMCASAIRKSARR